MLKQYYDFDNSPFLDHLRTLGFQVSDASRSNFYWTFLSVGSALNLDYIQVLLNGEIDPASRDRTELYRLLRDNRASQFLRARGYRYVHLQSTWGGTGSNPYADEFLPCHSGMFGNEYLRAVADASWLRALEFAGQHGHRKLPPAELRHARGPGENGRAEVRVRTLRAAASPVPV